jgi:hypothetical protein
MASTLWQWGVIEGRIKDDAQKGKRWGEGIFSNGVRLHHCTFHPFPALAQLHRAGLPSFLLQRNLTLTIRVGAEFPEWQHSQSPTRHPWLPKTLRPPTFLTNWLQIQRSSTYPLRWKNYLLWLTEFRKAQCFHYSFTIKDTNQDRPNKETHRVKSESERLGARKKKRQ